VTAVSGAIGIRDLSIDFIGHAGSVHAVRNVSLEIGGAEILGLVGESGSGKSTVALSLLGLLAPNARVLSGTMTLDGKTRNLAESGALRPLRGRDIAMVFQDPVASLNPVFTIGTHLDEVLRRREPDLGRSQRRGMATEALATVGIDRPDTRLKQHAHELSGGMRQRVVIAMALLARPKLLIADEPTTALDVSVESQVMGELCKLREEIGCAILLITHSLGLVTRYCDSVAVMYAGEMVERGKVDEVSAHAGHPYTKELFTCDVAIDQPLAGRPIDARFEVIAGDLPDLRALPPGCVFEPRCPLAFEDCKKGHPPMFPVKPSRDQEARCILLR
jgi:oligopeptide/dipeptide ABC transporter ATP-binding protein